MMEAERIGLLRNLMTRPELNLDAYIVPSEDAHQVILPYICTSHPSRVNILLLVMLGVLLYLVLLEALVFTFKILILLDK